MAAWLVFGLLRLRPALIHARSGQIANFAPFVSVIDRLQPFYYASASSSMRRSSKRVLTNGQYFSRGTPQ
jgi:hypothetical protein